MSERDARAQNRLQLARLGYGPVKNTFVPLADAALGIPSFGTQPRGELQQVAQDVLLGDRGDRVGEMAASPEALTAACTGRSRSSGAVSPVAFSLEDAVEAGVKSNASQEEQDDEEPTHRLVCLLASCVLSCNCLMLFVCVKTNELMPYGDSDEEDCADYEEANGGLLMPCGDSDEEDYAPDYEEANGGLREDDLSGPDIDEGSGEDDFWDSQVCRCIACNICILQHHTD